MASTVPPFADCPPLIGIPWVSESLCLSFLLFIREFIVAIVMKYLANSLQFVGERRLHRLCSIDIDECSRIVNTKGHLSGSRYGPERHFFAEHSKKWSIEGFRHTMRKCTDKEVA
jgi:hypothetical protein